MKLFCFPSLCIFLLDWKLNKWFSSKWMPLHTANEVVSRERSSLRVRRKRINDFFNFLSFSWPIVWQLDLSKSGKAIWHTYICSHICQSRFIKNQWLKSTERLRGANLWLKNLSNAKQVGPYIVPLCFSFWELIESFFFLLHLALLHHLEQEEKLESNSFPRIFFPCLCLIRYWNNFAKGS